MREVATKRLARTVGALYITGTVAGILSVVVTGTLFTSPDYLINIAANKNQVVMGTLLVLIMGFALALVPVLLFPILRKYSEILAVGAVVFRGAIEAVMYIAIAVGWLLLLTLSQEYVSGPSEITHFQTIGLLLQEATTGWLNNILSIAFSLGALMIYYVFFKAKLVPRWLSVWGLVGAILYLASPLFSLFDIELAFLMAPLALQEMVLAVWLIVKGFNPNPSDKSTEG